MNDPVLHRKLFREKALRIGALKPRRYVLGAPETGVSGTGLNPFFTQESQGLNVNERIFTNSKGETFKIVSPGKYERVYLPATIDKPSTLEPRGKFYTTMEAMLDPEKASERGTYKKIGEKAKQYGTQTKEFVEEGIASLKGKAGRAKEAIFNPQTYRNIGQGVGTLSKGLGLGVLGYGGASELAEATGTEGIVNPALTTVGGAQILGELAKKRLGYLAGPGRLLMNPYAAVGLGTVGTYANMMKSNYKELMSLPPEIRKQISESTNQGEIVFDSYALDPRKGGGSALVSPDNVLPTSGGTPPGGTPPGGAPIVSAPTGGGTPLATGTLPPGYDSGEQLGINTRELMKAEGDKPIVPKSPDAPKGNKGNQKQDPVLSNIFDKFGDFARSASGNAFLLKFAAGLLSGKGSFGEVVGNALNPAVDLFAAYKLREDEMNAKKIESLLKQQGDIDREPGAIRITEEIQNPDGTISTRVRAVPARRDKKTLQVYTLDGNNFTPVSAEQGNSFRPKNINSKDVSFALDGFGNTAAAIAIIDGVEKSNLEELGIGGLAKYNFYRGIGMLKGLGGAVSDITFGEGDKVYSGKDLDAAQTTYNSIQSNLDKMFQQMPENDRKRLAEMDVNSTTLRYYLANAFKQKDRLTQQDLNTISQLTKILAFEDPQNVKYKLQTIKKILADKSAQYLETARENGFSDGEFAERFYSSPTSKVTLGIIGVNNPEIFGVSKNTNVQQRKETAVKNFNNLNPNQQFDLFERYGLIK
jgi:hypothetical protein